MFLSTLLRLRIHRHAHHITQCTHTATTQARLQILSATIRKMCSLLQLSICKLEKNIYQNSIRRLMQFKQKCAFIWILAKFPFFSWKSWRKHPNYWKDHLSFPFLKMRTIKQSSSQSTGSRSSFHRKCRKNASILGSVAKYRYKSHFCVVFSY